MMITIRPTSELTEIDVNGHPVPMRIWTGRTEGGVDVEVYVYATTPLHERDYERFRDECRAAGMMRAASLADIGENKKDEGAT